MRNRRPYCLRFGLLSLLALVGCAALAVLASLALGLPTLAAEKLGAPSPDIDPLQRSLLAAYLLARLPALDAAAGAPEAVIDLEVQEGETAGSVVDDLQAAGIVRDGFLLRTYLRYRGLDVGVQAGRYALGGAMTVRQIAEALQRATALEIVFTVPEGWRREEIAAAIPAAGFTFTPDEFLAASATSTGFPLAAELPPAASLEGYLFPDTYRFLPDSTAADVVLAMVENFESRVDPGFRSAYIAQGLTLHEAVTLASIVEREAVVADERPLIASVFLNRLAAGMPLEADPTVQYALGLQPDGSWWKSPLTAEDLAINSPYNTYTTLGLPPGPIANPSLASLQAVAAPAETPYLYFRALCDGSGRHAFAATFEEHLQNACP
jgi:UPF0755 protein